MVRSGIRRGAGPAAVAGGLVWIVGAVGWLLTHGTQADWKNAELLGFNGTRFTQLLIVAAALWAVGLVGVLPGRRAARVAWSVGLVGALMVGVGALFETSIVDPDANFSHPIVQSGWLLFIGGLFPVLCAGMLGLAASSTGRTAERIAYVTIGAGAPLPVVAFFVGGLNAAGTGGILALALLHAAPGLGWIALGLVLARGRARRDIPEGGPVLA
jgi:hypothetical protein